MLSDVLILLLSVEGSDGVYPVELESDNVATARLLLIKILVVK